MMKFECYNAYFMLSRAGFPQSTHSILYQIQAHCRGCSMLCHKDDVIASPAASSLYKVQVGKAPAA